MLCGLRTGHARDITLVFIAARNQVHGISRTKEIIFQAGVFECGEVFWCSDWHEIVILFPLHLMPV